MLLLRRRTQRACTIPGARPVLSATAPRFAQCPADPTRRINIQQICNHPWFRENLSQELEQMMHNQMSIQMNNNQLQPPLQVGGAYACQR